MAWLYLLCAGIFEIVWAFYMKQSGGFTKLVPSIITIVAMAISVFLLGWSMKSLPLGTAYAAWTGIGTIGAFLLGIFVLNEPANAVRIVSALLIVSGLIGMRLSSGS